MTELGFEPRIHVSTTHETHCHRYLFLPHSNRDGRQGGWKVSTSLINRSKFTEFIPAFDSWGAHRGYFSVTPRPIGEEILVQLVREAQRRDLYSFNTDIMYNHSC